MPNNSRNKKQRTSSFTVLIMGIMNIVTLLYAPNISRDLFTFAIISSAISMIIILLFRYVFSVSNTIWNIAITLIIIVQGFIWNFYHKNGLMLHFLLVLAGLFSSFLSDSKINKHTIFMTIGAYLFFGTLIAFKRIDYSYNIVPFLILSFGVVFVQLQLMFLVGQITHYKKIISGNTESSQSMLRLIERKKMEAENANNAKSTFLTNMSHEIRTPINAILGLDEIILRECKEQKILDYAKNINNAGKMLLSLVNDILDFSKIENGKMKIVPDKYSLFSLLNDIVSIMQLYAKEKNLILKTDFSPKLPSILYGDEIRLKQIITNLLTNAVKYTEKGSITFKIDHTDIENDKIFLNVKIIDTGIGIKPENISKLFNKFERIDENKNIEGTGLGINITENLLNLMGSHLNIDSQYGVGSTFSFELEQKVIDRTTLDDANLFDDEIKESFAMTFTAEKAKLLIVDDNEMNLFVAKELLKHTKMQITTVNSGKKCLEVSRDNLFDIILMDHMMPDIDGLETLKILRSDENYISQNTPVIALTANAIYGAKEFYLNAGFDDYLTKPLEYKKIEDTLLKFLKKDLVTFISQNDCNYTTEYQQTDNTHIDIQTGISYTYNKENYIELLKMFDEKSPQRYEEIKAVIKKCSEDTCKKYTNTVHSLKNTAAMIGAKQLAEIALQLELAARKNDIVFLKAHHNELQTEYKIVEAEVKKMIKEGI